MYILKRNGKKQKFQKYKIITSIKNSAKDVNYPLTQGDINILRRGVESKIDNLLKIDKDRMISSLELRVILYEVLTEYSFKKIAKAYIET